MKPRRLGRMLMKILVLSTILTMLLSPLAIAPSHPVFSDEETGETIDTILDNEWDDAGIDPGSFWWGFELWYEDNIEKPSPNEQVKERLAEAHELMEVIEFTETTTATDTLVLGVQAALAEAQTAMTAVEAEIEVATKEAGDEAATEFALLSETVERLEPAEEYAEHLETALVLDEQIDALTYELEQTIATAAPPADSAAAAAVEAVETALDELQDETADIKDAVADLRDEIVDDIAEDQGITHIEAENALEAQETEAGTALVHELAVQDELAEVGEELTALRESIDTAQAAGEIVDLATLQLLYEATVHFEYAHEAFEDDNFGEALGQLTACEHITENAEDHLEQQEEIPPELDPSTVRDERLAEVREFLEEAPPLLAANPDDSELAVLTDNVQVLQQELQVEEKATELITAGKPPEEVIEALTAETAHIFGRTDYIPPVFTEAGGEAASRLADFDAEAANLQTEGGFVEDYAYLDPATGYSYTFTETGYQYTTPFGTVHKQDYPEGISIPKAYQTGNEQHTYTAPDGNKYTYTALGYSVSKPDGTTESFSYDLGQYEMPGGHGKLEVDPQGYTVFNERGRQEGRMEYVPEFGNYVGVDDGSVYDPELFEGKTIHEEAIYYDYDKHNYVFDPDKATDFFNNQYNYYNDIVFGPYVGAPELGEGAPGPGGLGPSGPGGFGRQGPAVSHDKWSYDPVANTWTNEETGESHQAEATMVAPVGHEEQGSYSTDYGETWTYDAATRGWTSDKGETFTAEGEGKVAGDYQDISGNVFDYSHEGTYTDAATGVAWSYEGSTHGWTSVSEGGTAGSSGLSGPSTGTAPEGTAGSVAPSTGTAVDQQGNVWSYDSGMGTWSSPTYSGTEGYGDYSGSTYSGSTYTGGAYSSGTYSSPPAGTDTGGHTSSGTYSGGSYSGSESGGSYSSGSYSGGDAGGSTGGSTGGDSGGGGTGGGDGGGGGSGDGGGGMGGYVVKEIRPAKELHPVTKFLLKYLGIKG